MKAKLILLMILCLGAFLRLYNIDSKMRFIWDEARDMRAIRHIWVEPDITLFGPYNEQDGKKDFYGVFHYYLMLLPLVVADFDPIGPSIFTALLGVATIGLVYVFLRQIGERDEVALATSLLYAVSPLVVEYQQWAWNPNTTAFFGMLFLILADPGSAEPGKLVTIKNYIKWFLAGVCLGLVFQLHYVSVAIGVVGIGMMVWGELAKRMALSLGILGIGFILPNLSFVVFDLTHQGFYSTIIAQSLFGGHGSNLLFQTATWWQEPIRIIAQIIGGLFGLELWNQWLISLMFVVISLVYWIKIPESPDKSTPGVGKLVLGVVWLVAMCGLVLGKLLKPYQLAPLFPLVLWVVVRSMDEIWLRRYPSTKVPVLIGVSVWLVYQNYIFRQPTWMENTPRIRQLSTLISSDAKQLDRPFNLTSVVEADNTALRYRYFVEKEGLKPLDLEEYPQAQVLYVISFEEPLDLSDNPEWQVETFKEASQSIRIGQVDEYLVYRVEK